MGGLPDLRRPPHVRSVRTYPCRKDSEFHLLNPTTIPLLQNSARTDNFQTFKEYSRLITISRTVPNIRGLMEFKALDKPIPIDEVEPVNDIVKRFKTGAMSYGSISKEAHEALAIAMNRMGGKATPARVAKIRRATCSKKTATHKQRDQASGFRPLWCHQ